jgi:hypothetical protein
MKRGMLHVCYYISFLTSFTSLLIIVSFLNLLVDAQILNFALSLELPEGEFYKRKKADYPAWVRGRFEQIYEDIFFSLVPDFRPYGI